MRLLARLRSTKLEAVWVVLGVLAGWGARFWVLDRLGRYLQLRAYGDWMHGVDAGPPIYVMLDEALRVALASYDVALASATLLMPLVLLARLLARSRVRTGRADPIDRVRAWQSRHPWWARGLTAVPGALTTAALLVDMVHWGRVTSYPFAVISLLGLTWLSRLALRALTAPTTDTDVASAPATVSDDEIAFSAVAVTRETLATVGVFAVMPVLAVTAMRLIPGSANGVFVAVMLAYIAVAGGGAALFQRASRIAVGIDGVLIHGTSRTRFLAYRDLDDVRIHGQNIELRRGGRVVMHLQVHGEDAPRRGAIVARIEEKIALAAARRDGTTESFVSSASREQLTRAVAGAVDFRHAPVSREALWEVVEGPTLPLEAREAAAAALVRTVNAGERARLRVAAARCAEPRMRVALEKLGEDDEAAGEAEAEAEMQAEKERPVVGGRTVAASSR